MQRALTIRMGQLVGQKRRTPTSCRSSVQLEALERRLALSVSIVPEGSTLHITGDDANQTLVIYSSHRGSETGALVSLDANGNGSFADPGDLDRASFADVATFDLHMAGGDDQVSVHLADSYVAANQSFVVDLGSGNDTFRFGASLTEQIRDNSTVRIAVEGGDGDDLAQVNLSHIRKSQVSVDLDTGAGSDTAQVFCDGDIADSTLTASARLGSGNDTFMGDLNLEDLDILGAASAARFSVNGGGGDDALGLHAAFGGRGAVNQGLLAATLNGGLGNDSLTMHLDRFNLDGGTFQLRANGGSGNDTSSLALTLDPASRGGTLDIAAQNGPGRDRQTAAVDDLAGTSQFGPAGTVLLDGGIGRDTYSVSGHAPFRTSGYERAVSDQASAGIPLASQAG